MDPGLRRDDNYSERRLLLLRRTDQRGSGGLVEERLQFGLEHLEELHGEAAGKVEAGGVRSRNIGGDGAVEAVAEEEHEGGGAVNDARGDDPASLGKPVE